MTKSDKLNIMKDRYNKLSNSPKNIKCPGALKKLGRQIRNIESTLK